MPVGVSGPGLSDDETDESVRFITQYHIDSATFILFHSAPV
jgi:hypothetical protein